MARLKMNSPMRIWYARNEACQETAAHGSAENRGNLTRWHLVCQKINLLYFCKELLSTEEINRLYGNNPAPPTMAEADIAIVRESAGDQFPRTRPMKP